MASPQDNIQLAVDALALQIKEATENPKPSYSVDGQQVDWSSYLSTLIDKMETLLKVRQQINIPYQAITKARMF
jgi:hypothetical protein